MAELPSERADSAPSAYEGSIIGHTHTLPCTRTLVNVECVHDFADTPYVPDGESTGEALERLRVRSGLSLRALAALAGYAAASGIQRYFNADYRRALGGDVAGKLARAMAGRGEPPIEENEVMRLTGVPIVGNAVPVKMEGASFERMRTDLPVYGTALGAAKVIEGESIEQTTLNQGEVVEYVKRPVILNDRPKAYGLYVVGSSMAPAHADGSMIIAERERPLRIGDDVVVYLRCDGDDDDGERARSVLVKRLVRRTASYIELEQFQPPVTFKIEAEKVVQIDRVLTLGDLLS